MNINEACNVLEISATATQDEAKKKYRELTKAYHPDVNKAPDAEGKFKKINEAYQVFKNKDNQPKQKFNFSDIFNHFNHQQNIPENIQLNTTISFKESVLGIHKDLSFKRKIKCKECEGQGATLLNNGCDKCGGKGNIISNQNNMIFSRTCDKCHGLRQHKACNTCSQSGSIQTEVSISVFIPPGVQNDNMLRLGSMGNYVGNFGPMDQYTDAFLKINVIPEDGLSLNELDVISYLDISLLEALQGCQKEVKTILGNKSISIPSKSKNKDSVIIEGLGVNRVGNQQVILNVSYPDNIDKLIKSLSES